MKIKPWFKTLLTLVVVIGPMYWLMFTADGQRRSDAVMLQLFGAEAMELDLKRLEGGIGEPELRKVYPDLEWHCEDRASDWGRRVCGATIGSWNGMPAYRIAFHFSDQRLRAMQMDYHAAYHQQLLTQLRRQLGRPADGSNSAADGVLQWLMANGIVVIKARLRPVDQAALIWVAAP